MHIAYLINHYPKVSHTFIRREIQALERQGVEVTRIAIHGSETDLVDPRDVDEHHKTTYLLQDSPSRLLRPFAAALLTAPTRFAASTGLAVQLGTRSDRGVARHLAYLAEAAALLAATRRKGISHVHAHFGTNSAAVALLAKQLGGLNYSFTIHGPEEFDRPEMLSLEKKIHEAKFVIAISSFGRSQIYRWAKPTDWPKVHVVRCALEPEYFTASSSPVPDVPDVVCVGRISPEKGHTVLVQAVAALAQRGVNIRLTIAGDGPMRGQIEALIASFGLQSMIRITGWLDNEAVRRHITAARALVLSSFAEGLPVVVMEALASGRPVIATSIAGIPELVEPGLSGWLLPASDVDSLAKALEEVVTLSPTKLTEMGEHGRRLASQLHNADTEASKLRKLFEQATA